MTESAKTATQDQVASPVIKWDALNVKTAITLIPPQGPVSSAQQDLLEESAARASLMITRFLNAQSAQMKLITR
jgi:hypothetical protein